MSSDVEIKPPPPSRSVDAGQMSIDEILDGPPKDRFASKKEVTVPKFAVGRLGAQHHIWVRRSKSHIEER